MKNKWFEWLQTNALTDLPKQRDVADVENQLFDACREIKRIGTVVATLDRVTETQALEIDRLREKVYHLETALSTTRNELKAMRKNWPKAGGCNCDCNKTYR